MTDGPELTEQEDTRDPAEEQRPFSERPLEEFDAPGEDATFRTGGKNEGLRVNEGDAQGPS